jgi:hypothetical protein
MLVEHRHKYEGDYTNIVYRSSWENLFFKWCCLNPDVVKFSSEEFFIPYISPVDDRQHRYFVDVKVQFASGKILLVEIKPAHQTKKPIFKKGKKRSAVIEETKTYAVNIAKWIAAEKYAAKRGWDFAVFTEHTLKSIGINLPGTLPKGKR